MSAKTQNQKELPLIVGISGASSAIYGVRILEVLRKVGIPSHLVISKSAAITLKEEADISVDEVRQLAAVTYPIGDIGAAISSGSFRTRGMVVAPCSVRTVSEIAYGSTDNLITRAADVVLKERRRLVLMVRETPLHTGHLRSMLAATENGAIIMPPVPPSIIARKRSTISSTRRSDAASICSTSMPASSSAGAMRRTIPAR